MTEAELCSRFADVAAAEGYVVYPETAGWDLLLVDSSGEQCGVEAKLRASFDVLHQAYDPWYRFARPKSGPTYRAVLVPKAGGAFCDVAGWLRLVVFDWGELTREENPRRSGRRSRGTHHGLHRTIRETLSCGHRWDSYAKPHDLPPVVPGVPAGVPSPVRLTTWKLGAIRVALRLRARGYVTSADHKACGIDAGRWVASRWLRDSGRRQGRRHVLVSGPEWVAWDEQHRAAVAQLLEAGEFTEEEATGAAVLLEVE
jgi:hypothetical protein